MKTCLVKSLGIAAIVAAMLLACAITFGQSCPPGVICPYPSAPRMGTPVVDSAVQPWRATVRIHVALSNGNTGTGTGTIILGNASKSIVLTCAHLFKNADESYPKSLPLRRKITIDLFDGRLSASGSVAYRESFVGECLGFDPGRDVGLVAFRPGRRLVAATIVPEGFRPEVGAVLIAVGCSDGRDATAWQTRYLRPMRLSQAPDLAWVCDVPPAQGRSGGGLHLASDGRLIGTCTGVLDNSGIYPSADSAWDLIRRVKLTSAIQQGTEEDREPTAELYPIETTPAVEKGKPGLFHPGKAIAKKVADAKEKKEERQEEKAKAEKAPETRAVAVQAVAPGFVPDAWHYILGILATFAAIWAACVTWVKKQLVGSTPSAIVAASREPAPTATVAAPPLNLTDEFDRRVAELLAISEADAARKRRDTEEAAKSKHLTELSEKLRATIAPTSPAVAGASV